MESRGLKPKCRPGHDEGSWEGSFLHPQFPVGTSHVERSLAFTCIIMISAFVAHLSLLRLAVSSHGFLVKMLGRSYMAYLYQCDSTEKPIYQNNVGF